MATVTDLTGSDSTITDKSSIQLGDDSNINVFEFGNLILADILPSILWLINYIADLDGSTVTVGDDLGTSITEGDSSMDNSIAYDFEEYTYEDTRMNYNGYPLLGLVDMSGS
jgi:hypothetical protein